MKDDSIFYLNYKTLKNFSNNQNLQIGSDYNIMLSTDNSTIKSEKIDFKDSLVHLEQDSNNIIKAQWLDNPSETNAFNYTTDKNYTQLLTNRANIEYIIGRKVENNDKLYVRQNNRLATIKIFATSDTQQNIYARWDNWEEIKDWERFEKNDNIIVNKSLADINPQTNKPNNTDYYCIGMNKDNTTAYCSAIGDTPSSGWNDSNINSGFNLDINTGYTTSDSIKNNAANKCLNLPYGDGFNMDTKTKGTTGLLFGEGNCNDFIGNSIFDINNGYIKDYNNNKIVKLDKNDIIKNETKMKDNIANSKYKYNPPLLINVEHNLIVKIFQIITIFLSQIIYLKKVNIIVLQITQDVLFTAQLIQTVLMINKYVETF